MLHIKYAEQLNNQNIYACKFLCLYVVVNIANEDRKLQTPADIIPSYARKI